MKHPKSVDRINKLYNGEKLKCPKCKDGYISAVGNPKMTNLFRCDECGLAIVPRIAVNVNDYITS